MKKLFVLIFAGIIFFAGCGNEETPDLKTEKISATNGVLTVTHDGKISLAHELMIHSNVSGKVLEKYFKDGDDVTERQKLFKIGDAEKETELLQAKTKLGELLTTLPKELAQKKSVDELQAEIADLKDRIKILEDESEAGMVYAPIAGKLGAESVRLGENVKANDTVLAKIGRTDSAAVRFEISAAEKNFLSTGKPKVSLKFNDGTKYSREGTINLLNDTTAEATFDNADGLLHLGDAVQIELDGMKLSNAVLVPESAIQKRDGENFVFVVDENKQAALKKISLGGKAGNQFVVNDGLKAGDEIKSEIGNK